MRRRDFIKLTTGTVAAIPLLQLDVSGNQRLDDESNTRFNGSKLILQGRSGGHSGPGINEDSDVSFELGLHELQLREGDHDDTSSEKSR